MFRDGQQISYVGLNGNLYGERGKVLEAGTDGSTVLWSTGAVTTEYNSDLITVGKEAAIDGLDDCLDVGEPLATTAVRQAYDDGGELAVLSFMNDNGGLSSIRDIADDVLAFIASRLRQDPYFRSVVAQLEDDESESIVRVASEVVLQQIGLE